LSKGDEEVDTGNNGIKGNILTCLNHGKNMSVVLGRQILNNVGKRRCLWTCIGPNPVAMTRIVMEGT
jgi:hypothetical protein